MRALIAFPHTPRAIAMPDAPDAEPKPLFAKLGAAVPVALTALATVLAGLSSGELNRAMFWRSAAAQDQARASDQWGLAGFKRDRALVCDTTADTIKAMDNYRNPPAGAKTPTPAGVERLGVWLKGGGDPPADDPDVRAVLAAVRGQRPEPEVLRLARGVKTDALERLIADGIAQADGIDGQFKAEADAAEAAMRQAGKADKPGTTAAKYEVDARRYKAESTANQWVGFLLEVRVKTSTATSDRHRVRSEYFFLAMLAAQVGAVGASLALAGKHKSVLWLTAGLAGLVAVGFGAFVAATM